MATTATSSCTATMRAFPLKYFVLAFTWLFWGLQLLSMRNVIPTLPGLTVIGTFGPLVAAVLALGASRQDAGKGEGRQEFMGVVQYSRSGRPGQGVSTSRFEPLTYLLGPWAFKNPFVGNKGIQGSFEGILVVGRGYREDRTMIQYRKTWQNTARTAHIIDNMVICRTFVRSVFTVIITRAGAISPASHR